MANLTHVYPSFIVASLEDAVAFYVDRLGFEIRYIGPEEGPYFAMVGRDKVAIMLKAVAAEIKPVPNHGRHEYAPNDAFIYADDPDVLYQEYLSAGITFHWHIRNDGDNLRGFSITDVDGYLLFFGRPWP